MVYILGSDKYFNSQCFVLQPIPHSIYTIMFFLNFQRSQSVDRSHSNRGSKAERRVWDVFANIFVLTLLCWPLVYLGSVGFGDARGRPRFRKQGHRSRGVGLGVPGRSGSVRFGRFRSVLVQCVFEKCAIHLPRPKGSY